MGKSVQELDGHLEKKQRAKEKVAAALASAHAEKRAAEGALSRAREDLVRIEATDPGAASWSLRRKHREAQDAVRQAEERLDAARETVAQRHVDFAEAEDAVLAVQAELAGPKLEALREQVAGLFEALRKEQQAAVETAKRLVRLHVEAVAAAPMRVVSRTSNRFLLVAPRDPELREGVATRMQIRGVEAGFFRLEYFRAITDSGPEGRFELFPGQDLSPPSEVEEVRAPAALPVELEAVKSLDLGLLVPSANGGQPGRKKGGATERVTFSVLKREVEQQRAAEKRGGGR